jgi:hypothetical protein
MPDFGSDESSDEDDEVSSAFGQVEMKLMRRESSIRKGQMISWRLGGRLLGIHCQSEHEH